MTTQEALFVSVVQSLSDAHVNIDDLFGDDTDKEIARELIKQYEDEIGEYGNEQSIEQYTKLAEDMIKTIAHQRELERKYVEFSWGKGYQEMGELIRQENEGMDKTGTNN